jgi:hypothetical protein
MKEKILIFLRDVYKKLRFTPFLEDKLILVTLLINFVSNLILWVVIIFKSRYVEIPFYNPVAASTRYLTPKGKEVYILPIVGLFIFLINLFLAFKIFKREKFLSYLLLGISLFVQILLLVTITIYLLI